MKQKIPPDKTFRMMQPTLGSGPTRVEMGGDGAKRSEMGGDGMVSVVVMTMMTMVMVGVKTRRVAGAERLENIKGRGEVLTPRVHNLLVVFKGVDGNE